MGWYWYQKSSAKCEELLGSSWRLTQAVLLIWAALPLLLFSWTLARSTRSSGPRSDSPSSSSNAVVPIRGSISDVKLTERSLLPYSVIPGGVLNAQELKSALANDPVAARHYADFDAANARVVRLERDRSLYVSYRLGNHVYWTTRKLTLLKGETVLTDGEHFARTRCGNRLAEAAQQPVSLKEPERAALENPQLPVLPDAVPEWEFPLADLISPSFPPVDDGVPPGGGFFIPPLVPPIVGGSRSPGSPTVPLSPATPPTAETPEPGSLLLLSSGFLSVWMARKRGKG